MTSVCVELLEFFREAAKIYGEMEGENKEYQTHKYTEWFANNVDFYTQLVNGTEFFRLAHLPKILKDRARFRKYKKQLRLNRGDLNIHMILKEMNAEFVETHGKG